MKKNNCFLFFLICIPTWLIQINVHAQDSLSNKAIDISKIRLVRAISKSVSSAYISGEADLSSVHPAPAFTPGIIHKQWIPTDFVTRKAVLRFNVKNSADTATGVYFFPGVYYRQIKLYRQDGTSFHELPSILPTGPDNAGYRYFQVGAHDSATIFAELVFIRTYLNTLNPRLIEPAYLNSFVTMVNGSHRESHLMTYLFCGLLLMMILFSIANFMQGANREFLYYSGYAFFLGVMLFTKAMFTLHTNHVSYFLEEYLDFILQSLGHMFYMIFMQKYLDTRLNHPFLHKFYNAGTAMLLLSLASYTFFHYFTGNFPAENSVENITKVLLLVMTVIFLVYSIRRWNDKLLRYLFWGNLCLFVFSLCSQSIIMFNKSIASYLPGIFSNALFYYELGLFLELVFFLMALNHKNRRRLIAEARERERLKAENQVKEYEKELAVFKAQQQERERISADIHDELGSGMTAIRLMSEIARKKMRGNVPVEIDKISQSADEVLNKMNAIIWSMDSGNDTLDNLVSYIRAYALEYFENTPIDCLVSTPATIESCELTGNKRRNIFLCVKETLNNALKHSKADEVRIDFDISKHLIIKVSDNGVGFDPKAIRQFGNGLKNIARRMESIGGSYEIENGQGTVTTLTLHLQEH